MRTHLLIVDPQNDFCDLPAEDCPLDGVGGGARLLPQLPVPGAHQDMMRLARFIEQHNEQLDDITVTLDSHHHIGIERPAFWRQGDGSPVAPFTPITAAALRAGAFRPVQADLQSRVQDYVEALEASGRYTLMVWPAHCEVGTWGHNVHARVHAAYGRWEESRGRPVAKVLKGLNGLTEHYSAVRAEVPDPSDARTDLNCELLDGLRPAKRIVIAGEAGSHCVRATLEHLLAYLPPGPDRQYVLLVDCTSPVAGFEHDYQSFLQTAPGAGIQIRASTEAWMEKP
ncbi:hypothetical protein CDEF62S_05276 [Castellaniella defragrans]